MKKFLRRMVVFFIVIAVGVFGLNIAAKKVFPLEYKDLVLKYAQKNRLDPVMVFSLIRAESNFDPLATSHRNARGLMQIIDSTGVWVAEKMGIEQFDIQSLYDPETNIKIGCWYLANLRSEIYEYSGETNNELILAAYNGGIGNVQKWLGDKQYSSSGKTLEKIPFKETENYIKRINCYYWIYERLYGGSI